MHQHYIVEVACRHASVLALAEQLGPHVSILVRLLILQNWHSLDLLIYCHEHLVVDRELLQEQNDLPGHFLLIS